eukprot:tig00021348_g20590.t1
MDLASAGAFISLRVGDVEVGTPVTEITPQGEMVWNQEHTFNVDRNTKAHVCVQVIDADTSTRMGYVEVDFAKMAHRTPPLVDTWLPLARSANVIKGTLHMLFFFNHFPDSNRYGNGIHESGYTSPGTPNTMTPLFPPRIMGQTSAAAPASPSPATAAAAPTYALTPQQPALDMSAATLQSEASPSPAVYKPRQYSSFSASAEDGDEAPRPFQLQEGAGSTVPSRFSCLACLPLFRPKAPELPRAPTPKNPFAPPVEPGCGALLAHCSQL